MLKKRSILFVAVPVLLSACASGPPFIDQMQRIANGFHPAVAQGT